MFTTLVSRTLLAGVTVLFVGVAAWAQGDDRARRESTPQRRPSATPGTSDRRETPPGTDRRRTTATRPDVRSAPTGSVRYSERSRQRATERRPGATTIYDRPRPSYVRPPRYGTVIASLPAQHRRLTYRSRDYYVYDNTYYIARPEAGRTVYRVCRPPVGVTISFLPEAAITLSFGSRRYYYCDDVYYEARPVLFGTEYVVVDPPIGATILELPDEYETVVVGGGTYYRSADYFFRRVYHEGQVVYERCPPPRVHVVQGNIYYRERLALPPNAELVVRLIDDRRPDRVIVERRYPRFESGAAPFELEYALADVDERERYRVAASVVVDGRERFFGDLRLSRVGDDIRGVELQLRAGR
ncbi:MAG: DUF6515 family protein [Phycisphaerae bacterium]